MFQSTYFIREHTITSWQNFKRHGFTRLSHIYMLVYVEMPEKSKINTTLEPVFLPPE